MNFLAPLAAAFGALSIPIVLLYMLRLRRTEMNISSNFLWQHLVRDHEANAPWQRLKFSWLLLLQLLILAALVLALMRPFVKVQTISAGRTVLLLDASASMNATDVEESRFEEAQNMALDLVDTMSQDDNMTLIRVAAVPEVLIAASKDRAELRGAIRDAQPSQTSADWVAALTLAAAGAQGAKDLNVVIISDGGLPGDLPEIPGKIRLATVGNAQDNLAISALATREIPGASPQLFAQITNYGEQDADTILSITLDDQLFDAQRYSVAAGQNANVVIDSLPGDFDTLTAALSAPARSTVPDYLATDDQAFVVYNPTGAGRVLLVTQRNIFLSQIFTSFPGVQLTQATPDQGLPVGDFDLYVFDSWLPDVLPQADIFMINPPASNDLFTINGVINDINQSAVTRVQSDDPRTQYLDFDQVNIRTFKSVTPIGEWATSLVQAVGGPLLLAGEVNSRQIAVLTFALQDSDLPLQLAYPIMITNLMRWYTPPHALQVTDSVQPGTAVVVRPLTGDAVRVTKPDDEQITLPLNDASQVVFAETDSTGIYRVEVREGDSTLSSEAFAVDLFDPAESNITPRESVTIGAATIGEAAREETGERELWHYLALAGLVFLLFEWLYYHRHSLRGLKLSLKASREALSRRGRRAVR